MHKDNAQQFQVNLENVARWAGYRFESDPNYACERCSIPLRDSDPEGVLCYKCALKAQATRIEEDVNSWIKKG